MISLTVLLASGQAAQTPEPPKADAQGNPIRVAKATAHVSNYDESKVKPYTLPDPLVFADGTPVKDAAAWRKRRAEIVRLYEKEIYGRVPASTPRVTWTETVETHPAPESAGRVKYVGTVGDGAQAPKINLTVRRPAAAGGKPVPLILLLNFGGGGKTPPQDPPVADEILRRGWAYATVIYQDIQPDRVNTFDQGVIGAAGGERTADSWGTITAWAWGVSRIIDFLATMKDIDPRRIALFGHSRLGKTALWASALDERIAAVYASCSGEMGAALARRDWGETVDDVAQNFPYWMAGNFQKYVGRWSDMPVDAHMLIALSAPRPVFVTGGTGDQWADPVGMFQALVGAGPVYRLLGRKDVGATALPALDTPLTSGDLGWHYHTGGHSATPADWQAFLQFVGKYSDAGATSAR